MKIDTSNASIVETESTKYFYIYEISCDGVIIPFNPKYLISYLLNDKLLLQSYTGDVYESVKGTWGSLGTGSQSLQFSLTLEVNTIRLSVGELIDTIYSNYNFNSIEKVKKLILLAACSKAMLVSLLYLIFYNIIGNSDLERLCEFNFNDLYEYVLNKLKENCLTENPLETNFETYIDDASYASGRFCEPEDKVVDHDETIKITVNKDVYKNIFKYTGSSVTYDNSQLTLKSVGNNTDWLYEADYDANKNKITRPAKPCDGSNYSNLVIKSMNTNGNLRFFTLYKDVVKNTSSHIVIKIPSGTTIKAPLFLWLTQNLKTNDDIILYPGDSVDLKTRTQGYSTAWGIGNMTFLDNTTIQVKEYKRDWYQSISEDIRTGRIVQVSGDDSAATADRSEVPYSGEFRVNVDIGNTNLNALSINNRKIKNNTSDLTITIPDRTRIKISHWLGGVYDVQTNGKIELGPGKAATIEFTNPFSDPSFSESGLNWIEILAIRAAKAVYNSINKDSFNVKIYSQVVLSVTSTTFKPVISTSTTISKPATIFLYGDQYTIDNDTVSVTGLAKIKRDYKIDLYEVPMQVSGLTDTQGAMDKADMNNIKNMLSFTPVGGAADSIDFTLQNGTNNTTSMPIVTSSIDKIDSSDINSFACADLTDDNPNTVVQIVPSNALISPTENVGLTYRPKLTINLDNSRLLQQSNVKKLIDAMIAAESPVAVTPETENYIIKVEQIKYRPVVDVEFVLPPTNVNDAADTYTDLQFILNYTDFEMVINDVHYVSYGEHPNLSITGVHNELLTTITAAEYDANNKFSINLLKPMASKFKFVEIPNKEDMNADMLVFNRTAYKRVASKHPATVNILKVRLTGADVLSTIDVSEYNIFLYNGNFYKGSDMGV